MWCVPAGIIAVLGTIVWDSTHKLDPYLGLSGGGEPVRVQVIAQDWKWLFLYPNQGVASVNELAFIAGRPLSLQITSNTVMNAFFVPALGSQINAMPGMNTELNLLAWEPGQFVGRNAQLSGDGFDEQYFSVVAMTTDDFSEWADVARRTGTVLDAVAYDELVRPSAGHPVTYYSSYESGLYETVIHSYMGHAHESNRAGTEAGDAG